MRLRNELRVGEAHALIQTAVGSLELLVLHQRGAPCGEGAFELVGGQTGAAVADGDNRPVDRFAVISRTILDRKRQADAARLLRNGDSVREQVVERCTDAHDVKLCFALHRDVEGDAVALALGQAAADVIRGLRAQAGQVAAGDAHRSVNRWVQQLGKMERGTLKAAGLTGERGGCLRVGDEREQTVQLSDAAGERIHAREVCAGLGGVRQRLQYDEHVFLVRYGGQVVQTAKAVFGHVLLLAGVGTVADQVVRLVGESGGEKVAVIQVEQFGCRVVLGDDLAGFTGKQESGNIGRRLRDGCAAGIVIEQSLEILVHSIFLLIKKFIRKYGARWNGYFRGVPHFARIYSAVRKAQQRLSVPASDALPDR